MIGVGYFQPSRAPVIDTVQQNPNTHTRPIKAPLPHTPIRGMFVPRQPKGPRRRPVMRDKTGEKGGPAPRPPPQPPDPLYDGEGSNAAYSGGGTWYVFLKPWLLFNAWGRVFPSWPNTGWRQNRTRSQQTYTPNKAPLPNPIPSVACSHQLFVPRRQPKGRGKFSHPRQSRGSATKRGRGKRGRFIECIVSIARTCGA